MIEPLFKEIDRALFFVDGKLTYRQITQKLIELSNAIMETEDVDWELGEGGHTSLADLIIGAYWHYTQYHRGQESLEYAALSALGQVFQPGMSSGPEEDSSEKLVMGALAVEAKNEVYPL